jgi:glutamyl-tRNA synthetase
MKSRFCPSPTGHIHLGNLRTALFNVLLARAHPDGCFLLRIEDTDRERSQEAYTDSLMTDLRWLGMDWQEGPQVGGEHGPYHQSARQSFYDGYYRQLLDAGHAYPCFCTEEQLALSRKIQLSSGQPPRYAGTCRDLPAEEVAAKQAADTPYTLRFRVPKDCCVTFTDMVKGEQSLSAEDMSDFIICRTDGTAPFLFCNAIDDAMMGVSHVLRGEDHLTNTPRQLLLLQTLGLAQPQYGHISLILGDDGAPLSKRNGSMSVQGLRQTGYLPMAILNYLARLGHHYSDDGWLDRTELAAAFRCESLGKAPAKFDLHQLNHWQKEAIQRLDVPAFLNWCEAAITDLLPAERWSDFASAVKENCLFPDDAAFWATRLAQPFSWRSDADPAAKTLLQQAHDQYIVVAIAAVQQHGTDSKAVMAHIKQHCQVKGKALFMPMRVLLTGQLDGPELSALMTFLGKEAILQRLKSEE